MRKARFTEEQNRPYLKRRAPHFIFGILLSIACEDALQDRHRFHR
jgi:hypothetical protein